MWLNRLTRYGSPRIESGNLLILLLTTILVQLPLKIDNNAFNTELLQKLQLKIRKDRYIHNRQIQRNNSFNNLNFNSKSPTRNPRPIRNLISQVSPGLPLP